MILWKNKVRELNWIIKMTIGILMKTGTMHKTHCTSRVSKNAIVGPRVWELDHLELKNPKDFLRKPKGNFVWWEFCTQAWSVCFLANQKDIAWTTLIFYYQHREREREREARLVHVPNRQFTEQHLTLNDYLSISLFVIQNLENC